MMPQLTLKLAGYILAGVTAIWAVWFVYDLLTASTKTKARLGENQTEAAIQSGQDAVSTVGAQGETETARNQSTKEMQNEVNEADNVADAHAAGSDWLCEYASICPQE